MQPLHILTQMGILSAFSVAKKITEEDVSKFFKKYKKTGKTEEEIGVILRDKIYEEIHDALLNQKIPGLISAGNLVVPSKDGKDDGLLVDLNKFIVVIAHKLAERNYNKMSLCYFINSLVNLLGLTEKDFEQFHRKMSEENKDENDDDDNDDDD